MKGRDTAAELAEARRAWTFEVPSGRASPVRKGAF